MAQEYYSKYLKYKSKYNTLKLQFGGGVLDIEFYHIGYDDKYIYVDIPQPESVNADLGIIGIEPLIIKSNNIYNQEYLGLNLAVKTENTYMYKFMHTGIDISKLNPTKMYKLIINKDKYTKNIFLKIVIIKPDGTNGTIAITTYFNLKKFEIVNHDEFKLLKTNNKISTYFKEQILKYRQIKI